MEEESIVIANLPIIDLLSPDLDSTAATLRQSCIDFGFFYIVNHGVDKDLFKRLFEESQKFFTLPLEDKMKLARKEICGYTPLYHEKLDTAGATKGDSKEFMDIGPFHDKDGDFNQWPSEELLPNWRKTVEAYHDKILTAGKRLYSLIALALNLSENYFKEIGALNPPMPFIRLLRYPGELSYYTDEVLGASAHCDYGMMTLLATDGVPGLQVCREKHRQPRIWEDVRHIDGALVVNIGDLTERWTNNVFRSTLHRVVPTGQERYSVAFYLDPSHDLIVKCLETCCNDSNPPRYPPFRYIDYLLERFKGTFEA